MIDESTNIFNTSIQVRFNDTDALGHLNNTSYALYAEQARVEFFRLVGQQVGGLILAHLSLNFRQQVHFGASVSVRTQVEKLGNSSITLYQEVMSDNQCAADVRSVVVLFDFKAQKSMPIPDAMRQQLSAYLKAS